MSLIDQPRSAESNLRWPHRGGSFEDLMLTTPEHSALAPPAPDEVIALVEAVSICSSDIKIVRMGSAHPLFLGATGTIDTVLGHEVCLRVQFVGEAQKGRFRPGQRLGLQPALVVDGKRSIIGMDLPGGFAQYLRLGPDALDHFVLPVPDDISAAAIALLEPYGCVERGWRPNARNHLKTGGRALVVSAGDADFHLSDVPDWDSIAVVGPTPDFLAGRHVTVAADLAALEGRFDDILALGALPAADLARLCALLNVNGMLLQGRRGPSPGPVALDPARVHYDGLVFVGTSAPDLGQALLPAAQRFDVRPGGAALIHGAGGAMGRIHVHRLLQMAAGPRVIIASSRKGQRLEAIGADFGEIARANGRDLVLADAEALPAAVARHAPRGLDDAVVVAPDAGAVAEAAGWLAPDGLLQLFAGFPYGRVIDFDLGGVALTGKRLTGSTGCSVEDMKDVLARVERHELDLSANIAAVAGLNKIPQAFRAVAEGTVAGKVVLFPQSPDMAMRVVDNWGAEDEVGLIGPGREHSAEDSIG